MSIRGMSIGDTLIGVDRHSAYTVEEKDRDTAKARSIEKPKRLKTFKAGGLEGLDADDGLCPEMPPAQR